MIIPAVTFLAKAIGPVMAEKVISSLKKSTGSNIEDKLKVADRLINNGVSAVAAFQKVFGADFDNAINDNIGAGASDFKYEAESSQYIKLNHPDSGRMALIDTLRDELNINLDRLSRMKLGRSLDVNNIFSGVFSEWMARYDYLIGPSKESTSTFAAIKEILNGKEKNYSDVFRVLHRAGLGSIGAVMIIFAGMLAASAGIGVWAAFLTWMLGIPVVQVVSLIIGGVLLIALSRVNFDFLNAMSVSVKAAYALLDDQRNSSSKDV